MKNDIKVCGFQGETQIKIIILPPYHTSTNYIFESYCQKIMENI